MEDYDRVNTNLKLYAWPPTPCLQVWYRNVNVYVQQKGQKVTRVFMVLRGD